MFFLKFIPVYGTYVCVGIAAASYGLFLAGAITEEQFLGTLAGMGIAAPGFMQKTISDQQKIIKEISKKQEEMKVGIGTGAGTGAGIEKETKQPSTLTEEDL